MNDILKIINHYGVISQQRKFAEEVFELQEAITIMEKEDDTYPAVQILNENNIAEEIADCIVLLNQFKEYYNISNEKLKEIVDYKIDRQLKRIEKEGE